MFSCVNTCIAVPLTITMSRLTCNYKLIPIVRKKGKKFNVVLLRNVKSLGNKFGTLNSSNTVMLQNVHVLPYHGLLASDTCR